MSLCKYSSMFGEPNTGVHSFRVMNIAVVDVIASLLLAYLISIIFNVNLVITILCVFVAGIIMHRLFCVRTTVDKLLFPNAR